jgi:hypothetical protein
METPARCLAPHFTQLYTALHSLICPAAQPLWHNNTLYTRPPPPLPPAPCLRSFPPLQNPQILLLNIELELKSEKENAEIRLDDPAQYQSIVDAGGCAHCVDRCCSC